MLTITKKMKYQQPQWDDDGEIVATVEAETSTVALNLSFSDAANGWRLNVTFIPVGTNSAGEPMLFTAQGKAIYLGTQTRAPEWIKNLVDQVKSVVSTEFDK